MECRRWILTCFEMNKKRFFYNIVGYMEQINKTNVIVDQYLIFNTLLLERQRVVSIDNMINFQFSKFKSVLSYCHRKIITFYFTFILCLFFGCIKPVKTELHNTPQVKFEAPSMTSRKNFVSNGY